ncbi:hypothetical protein HZH66_001740 [Vespula vulgaris]|uniref:Uncharacterized protein n=1 Tax=Vespula vulgaris TaxID=7454 RepID=A0A834KI75_VESVU|nr:hypothetical protein HZH66_001740 [Vespula vulgaris]
MWRMQEGRIVSPLGPVVLPREEADTRVPLSMPSQERRHVLLHVRTADPFLRYENVRAQQQTSTAGQQQVPSSSPPPHQQPPSTLSSPSVTTISPILRAVARTTEELDGSRSRDRKNDVDMEMEDEEEEEEDDRKEREADEEDDDEDMEDDRKPIERRNRSMGDEEEEEEEQEEDDEDDSRENRDEEDVEVDVCREEGPESNPSSPVDLTAPSSRGTDQQLFLNPFGTRMTHGFSCVQGTGPGGGHHGGLQMAPHNAPSVYISGHVATGSAVMTICSGGNASSRTATGSITSTTATSTVPPTAKRCLAFSVENILDPNKFTGGRVIHNRVQHRRHRRSGSVNEGE